MNVVGLDVLCDVICLSSHSVNGSLHVGGVWHRYWWLLCGHGGDGCFCYVAWVKGYGWLRGSRGGLNSLWALWVLPRFDAKR
jgi:hypothetical protein